MSRAVKGFVLTCVLGVCAGVVAQEAKSPVFDLNKAVGKDAAVTPVADGARGLKIAAKAKPDGWAGVEIPAVGGKADLSRHCFVLAEVRSLGAKPGTISLRLENSEAAKWVSEEYEIDPRWGWTWTKVPIRRPADSVKLKMFGMVEYPWGRPYAQRKPVTAHGDYETAWLALYPYAVPYGPEPPGVDPGAIAKLCIGVANAAEDCVFEVRNIRPAGTAPSAEMLADTTHSSPGLDDAEQKQREDERRQTEKDLGAPRAGFFPCMDEFGQYIHAEWPGKTHEAADLKKAQETEKKELETNPGPEDWDRYGGWKNGPTLKATGFFRTERHEGKWWLVDPEGRLFFSAGLSRVGPYGDAHGGGSERDETPVQDREFWFKGLADLQAQFRECSAASAAVNVSGYYSLFQPQRSFASFDFGWANSKRKYISEPTGPAAQASYMQRDWKEDCGWMVHKRLRSWGLNTIGSFSSGAVCAQKKTPYVRHFLNHHWAWVVHAVDPKIGWDDPMVGVFFDPFPAKPGDFRDFIAFQCKQEFGPHLNDPWCIGFMIDAEFKGGSPIFWGDDDVSLALGALAQRVDPSLQTCAKLVLMADLKAKYGTVEKLNAAWGAKYASWEAMTNQPEYPDITKARDDLVAFNLKILEEYFKANRDAIKSLAPNQLYVGSILSASTPPTVIKAAAKYCDVVSFRLNWPTPAGFKLPDGIDVPALAAEFGFSALDRGLLAGNLPDQAARADAYKAYLTAALKHPQFVGCHWLQYRDYPATGRAMDEANHNVGFVDIVDTPYTEMVQAAREIGSAMYRTRARGK